ncbi:MAG: hypothetical protein ACR2JY_19190 [Chloroflexota bacterium]
MTMVVAPGRLVALSPPTVTVPPVTHAVVTTALDEVEVDVEVLVSLEEVEVLVSLEEVDVGAALDVVVTTGVLDVDEVDVVPGVVPPGVVPPGVVCRFGLFGGPATAIGTVIAIAKSPSTTAC